MYITDVRKSKNTVTFRWLNSCIHRMLLGMMAEDIDWEEKCEPSTMLSRKVGEVHESYL